MRHSIRIPVILLLIVPIFLTACQGKRSETDPAPLVVEERTKGSPSIAESQEKSMIEPAKTPVAEPSLDIIPTPREGLEATDPSAVVLASGKPTLVEFFAFW